MIAKLMGVVLVVVVTISAQIQSVDGVGTVDWNKRVVTAVGIGVPNPSAPAVAARPMAIRAARQVALRNALELIKGIHIDGETTIENFMVKSDVVQSQVEGYIRSFKMGAPKYMSDKSIEVLVEVPLSAALLEQVLPQTVAQPTSVAPVPAPVEAIESSVKPLANEQYTGLIIDARGLGVMPSLGPKLFNEKGTEIYGSANVTRSFAVKWGMAGYAKTPEQAKKMVDRLGENPGIIKAKKGTGASRCDLVLKNKDAESIVAAAESMKFLADCRVVILVD
ncbi:MAG: LPP20 family lipoprotein [Fibrobacterales bacterium]